MKSLRASIPNHVPYIRAERHVAAKWRRKIGDIAGTRKKVGVVWAGNPKHSDDKNRSIAFDLFSQLFGVENVFWIRLQIRRDHPQMAKPGVPIFDCAEELNDFSETAGLIENLDLVIAVDTAVAHLAGAMGKKTWLLLPYRPDWRWGLHSEKTVWYPTMRLFRQRRSGDWQEVLARVKKALYELIG